MTDRELLEMAAKAAGIEIGWIDPVWNDPEAVPYIHLPRGKLWNPLTDDGDALRLAVKLDFDVAVYRSDVNNPATATVVAGYDAVAYHNEPHGDDKYAATRRAIVRAAAEIGKAMS